MGVFASLILHIYLRLFHTNEMRKVIQRCWQGKTRGLESPQLEASSPSSKRFLATQWRRGSIVFLGGQGSEFFPKEIHFSDKVELGI